MKKIGFEAEYFIANASDIDIYLNRNAVSMMIYGMYLGILYLRSFL